MPNENAIYIILKDESKPIPTDSQGNIQGPPPGGRVNEPPPSMPRESSHPRETAQAPSAKDRVSPQHYPSKDNTVANAQAEAFGDIAQGLGDLTGTGNVVSQVKGAVGSTKQAMEGVRKLTSSGPGPDSSVANIADSVITGGKGIAGAATKAAGSVATTAATGAAATGAAAGGSAAGSGGVAAAGGGLAAAAAATGPIGITVAAVAAAVLGSAAIAAGVAKVARDTLNSDAERIRDISPHVATADAMGDVRRQMADIRRSDRVGERVGDFVTMQSRFEDRFSQIGDVFSEVVADMFDRAEPFLEKGLQGLDVIIAYLEVANNLRELANATAEVDAVRIRQEWKESRESQERLNRELHEFFTTWKDAHEAEEGDRFLNDLLALNPLDVRRGRPRRLPPAGAAGP